MLPQLQEQLVGLAELGLTVAASSSTFPQSFSIDLIVQALGSGEVENFNTVQELLENVLPATEAVLLLPLLPLLQAPKDPTPTQLVSPGRSPQRQSTPTNSRSNESNGSNAERERAASPLDSLTDNLTDNLTFGTQVVDRAAEILRTKGVLEEGANTSEYISDYISRMLVDWVLSAEHARVWLALDFVVRTGTYSE
jgi:hypothetical protein